MHTIENPPIPFNFPIIGGMQTGSELVFTGATYNGQNKRFHINLLGQGDDIVLHFNPRFKFFEDTIVLNTRSYAGWGTEERHRNRMSVGDTFRIRIVTHHSHFLVLVNEKDVCHFEHRLSPQMVRGLEIAGDVTIHRINMINFPQSQAPHSYAPPPFPSAPPPHQPQYPPLNPEPDFSRPYHNAGEPRQNADFSRPYHNAGGPSQNAPAPNCHHCNSYGCHHCRH